jgi:hypothetical protein
MKLVGDKSIFAYQWEIADYEGDCYWGNFCFWIGGKQIGSYSLMTTLSITIYNLVDFLAMRKYRTYAGSIEMTKEQIFERLYYGFINSYGIEPERSFRESFWPLAGARVPRVRN